MQNSRSAINRIKNSLSYKLGFTILEHIKRKGIKYTTLPYKLYKIKKQHAKEQELYRQVIKIFPELKYCKLESCEDYNKSLRYRCHLSYMLGEILIKAHKTWYKGGYFKMFYSLKEKYRLYQNIQEIISILPEDLHYYFYNLIIKSYKINIQDLASVIKRHRNYMPILENIFQNFDFFIQYFEFVQSWLLSDEFEKIYKQENHPYPPLFDPQKLNDKNEKVNYKNISAELAWKMNFPFPNKYKFCLLSFGLAGHVALDLYLRKCSCCLLYANQTNLDKIYHFKHENLVLNVCSLWVRDFEFQKKVLYLLHKTPILILVRDPIERIKHGVNHGYYAKSKQKPYDEFNMGDDVNVVLDRFKYYYNSIPSDFPYFPESVDNILNKSTFLLNSFIDKNKNYIYYIDMKEILPDKSFETICQLSKKFKFNSPKQNDLAFFREMKNNIFRYILPLIMNINYNEQNIKIYIENSHSRDSNVTDLFEYIYGKEHIFYGKVYFYLKKEDFKFLDIKDFILYIKKYIDSFMYKLNLKISFMQKHRINESNVLDYFKTNKTMAIKLKKILDNELTHIKQYSPNIIASWKYYQDFERVCKNFIVINEEKA